MQTENYTTWMPVQIYYSLNVLTGEDLDEISIENFKTNYASSRNTKSSFRFTEEF